MKHPAGKNLALTDYLSRHPTEEAPTEEVHDDEKVINILSELFELYHKYSQILNEDQKFRPTNHNANMTSKTNRQSTNEIASPKKPIPDDSSEDFTREQAEAINSITTNFNPLNETTNFDFTDLKWKSSSITSTTFAEQIRK